MSCFKEFSRSRCFPTGLNFSFIALIPKIAHPKLFTDFRPISLIDSIAKLFIKLITERLSLYNNKLIGGSQYGFMRGRQVSESILIVNEVCHS